MPEFPSITLRLLSRVICAAVIVDGLTTPAHAQPIPTRNQHPLAQLFGMPAPLPARLPRRGETAVSARVNWSNFASADAQGDLQYTLDGEVFEARLALDQPLGERWALHGEVAWRDLSAGSLDSTVDAWHEMFSLGGGARAILPDDSLLLEFSAGDTSMFRVVEDGSGVADVPLGLGWQALATDTAALAAWLSVKLPVGSVEDFTGSGALDVAASLAGQVAIMPTVDLFAQADVTWLGEGDLMPGLQEDLAWSALAGATWHAWRGLDLTAQVAANAAVYDTGLDELDGSATVVTFGGDYRTPSNWLFGFAVSEDVQVDASPDVVFHLHIEHGF
jgi:hypothetical protein